MIDKIQKWINLFLLIWLFLLTFCFVNSRFYPLDNSEVDMPCNFKCVEPNTLLFVRCIDNCVPFMVQGNLSRDYCDYCYNVG